MLDQGRHIDEQVWVDLIKSADLNGDGEISYPEFVKMMENLVNKDSPNPK